MLQPTKLFKREQTQLLQKGNMQLTRQNPFYANGGNVKNKCRHRQRIITTLMNNKSTNRRARPPARVLHPWAFRGKSGHFLGYIYFVVATSLPPKIAL